ncbi:Mitochondrial inner membrane translocase subunit Tim17/Tim22/Tim23/peroxisomal protein PMP24 [Perkinsela sp. CCAP 1560/4]|nr:Mitochondrial inner membrane translocase subunit Tim17/Tim22/Tim23/peroxisomal protein PMP24 [Perkinsela sp. CCAP 1560/4]|eukprot:KNH08708.1 Mitochondrial inner membrane translocase subunit Tim17/Tim22/Tim23/peroxisomal protein PMP24 [Perkinsela sp. CCAP 1560/4]
MLLIEQPPAEPMIEALTWARETTLSAGAAGLAGGYVMGTGFSFFHALLTAESSTQAMGVRDFVRTSLRTAHRSGCNFGTFGLFFGAVEVALEKRRGRKDMYNPGTSGALMGGYYGWRSYRGPGLVGGVVGGAVITILFEKMICYMTGAPMHPIY